MFGASDEILGVIESGVDIERRIAQVYQECRDLEEIATEFNDLQRELEEQIQTRLDATRRSLLEHFDEDVSERLRVHKDKTLESLNERERWLFELTRTELNGEAQFDAETPRFFYTGSLASPGHYHLDWKEAERRGDTFYRQNHPLAAALVERAAARPLPTAVLRFNYAGYGAVVSVLKPFIGRGGWLEVSKLSVQSLETEEYLLFAGTLDSGESVDAEVLRKLLLLPAAAEASSTSSPDLSGLREREMNSVLKGVEERNARFFDEEVLKLDRWSEDLKHGLEHELKELDKAIRESKKMASLAGSLSAKLDAQKQVKSLESTRNKKRRELFEAQDQVDSQREHLIGQIEEHLRQKVDLKLIFRARWELN